MSVVYFWIILNTFVVITVFGLDISNSIPKSQEGPWIPIRSPTEKLEDSRNLTVYLGYANNPFGQSARFSRGAKSARNFTVQTDRQTKNLQQDRPLWKGPLKIGPFRNDPQRKDIRKKPIEKELEKHPPQEEPFKKEPLLKSDSLRNEPLQKDSLKKIQDSFEKNENSFVKNQDSFEKKPGSFETNQDSFEKIQGSFEKNQDSFEKNQDSYELNHIQNSTVPPKNTSTLNGTLDPGQFFSIQEPRTKRGVIHLYNMVSCATGCNPLIYKGYGCYCGFLGSGYAVDGIDRCCKLHDWCYNTANCPMYLEYFVPYFWKCYHNRPLCAVDHGEWGGYGSCAQRLCECDRVLSECLSRYPCPSSRAICRSSPWRFIQNALMLF